MAITGGDCTEDDLIGYIIDEHGQIKGEAKRYDPYSKFGEMLLYDIDSFGFVHGFLGKGWQVMSESDLMQNECLRRSLEIAKYDVWKRRNITSLAEEYDVMFRDRNYFERFCRSIYKGVLEKEKHDYKTV
ncbi:MAG: hypothetical protein WD717_06575 [Nitrosarchaeum sp.]